ncbi:hypothetical protein TNCV_4692811 [Trichonephila clavipes]|nr:hypothetical protein TNCV_4692811 [Trichonephila clavipes]
MRTIVQLEPPLLIFTPRQPTKRGEVNFAGSAVFKGIFLTKTAVSKRLTDRLEEINLRVGRLQEASSVTARKTGGILFTEGRMFSNVFIVAFKDIDKRSVERSRGTFVQPITSPRRSAASDFSVSRHPGFDGRHVHFQESAFRDNYAAPRHPVRGRHTTSENRGFRRYTRNDNLNFRRESRI